MGLLKEFRSFALKGNVVDMAVGVIIGAAFGGIVKSLSEDLIMPLVGIAGKADFSNFYVGLNESTRNQIQQAIANANGLIPSLEEARKMGPVLAYGSFITVVINFFILAACVFAIVKLINTAQRTLESEREAAKPAEPPADVKLLTEIRDLLRGDLLRSDSPGIKPRRID